MINFLLQCLRKLTVTLVVNSYVSLHPPPPSESVKLLLHCSVIEVNSIHSSQTAAPVQIHWLIPFVTLSSWIFAWCLLLLLLHLISLPSLLSLSDSWVSQSQTLTASLSRPASSVHWRDILVVLSAAGSWLTINESSCSVHCWAVCPTGNSQWRGWTWNMNTWGMWRTHDWFLSWPLLIKYKLRCNIVLNQQRWAAHSTHTQTLTHCVPFSGGLWKGGDCDSF